MDNVGERNPLFGRQSNNRNNTSLHVRSSHVTSDAKHSTGPMVNNLAARKKYGLILAKDIQGYLDDILGSKRV